MIPPALRAAMHAHARAVFPDECCGYLRGSARGTAVDELVACHNAQRDGGHPTEPNRDAGIAFVITGRELFDFARTFAGDRPARILYHSHANGRAYFSAVDRDVALGGGYDPAHPSGPAYPVEHVVIGVRAVPRVAFAPAPEPEPEPDADADADAVAEVTETAQFAWSATARDFLEVARWSGP